MMRFQPPGTPAHGASKHTDRTRSLFVPAAGLASALGTPTRTMTGSWATILDSWTLHNAGADGLSSGLIPVPADWASGTVSFSFLFRVPSGSGNVVLDLVAKSIAVNAGEDPTGANEFAPSSLVVTCASGLQKATFAGGLTVAAGEFMRFALDRNGPSGSDTDTHDMDFYGVLLEYTADM
jgi:hypothetical protein